MSASKNGLFRPVYCSGCGNYTELGYTTKSHQYCSNACKQKAYRNRQKRTSSKTQPNLETVKSWYRHGLGCFAGELFDHYEKFGEDSTNYCVGMMNSFLYTTGLRNNVQSLPDKKLTELAITELEKRYG